MPGLCGEKVGVVELEIEDCNILGSSAEVIIRDSPFVAIPDEGVFLPSVMVVGTCNKAILVGITDTPAVSNVSSTFTVIRETKRCSGAFMEVLV